MAFHLTETEKLSWTTSDVLGAKHMFTRRIGGVGDYPYSSNPDPEWERSEIQRRVRGQWLALIAAGELPEEGICFTGDTVFCGSVGRTDLPTGSQSAIVRSIKEKLLVLPPDVQVYPGHEDFTTIEQERKYNPVLG